ncbi:beta-galactosidase [Elysia marginata]|uniref:Beta-galactosidase n=1 Tax=Elysia marginata TaxID=1093978 RepID=A0AAV4I7T0_9GAST|nr:beta-galactosidase [Elysia marginata]
MARESMSTFLFRYMFVGGTNFGFTNGANSPPYGPVPTSYDYDSPISEAGDITSKYYAVRDIISKYLPLPAMSVPSNTTKADYGPMPMEFVMTVQDALKYLSPLGPTKSEHPVSMEKIKFYYGFIMYRFTLKKDTKVPSILSTKGVRDRAIVMVNHVPFGILDRDNVTVNITGSKGQAVDILVENMGRINYGSQILNNTKGLIEDVMLDGDVVTGWEIYPLYLENLNQTLAAKIAKQERRAYPKTSADGKLMTPSIYVGSLVISGQPNDTFLDPTTWGKGQAVVNDFNLGRYWPGRGPQVTLFVPAPVLVAAPKINYLFLFELETAPCDQGLRKDGVCQVKLTDTPCLDGPNGPGKVAAEGKLEMEKLSEADRHLVH